MVKYEFDGRSLEPYPEDALRGNVQLYLASEVDARIADLERVRQAAATYLKNWCMDEAYDSSCCCEQQHEEAKALRDARKSCL